MKCMSCKKESKILYQWMDYINCRNCCKDYWKDNDLGEEQSFEDFLGQMKKLGDYYGR